MVIFSLRTVHLYAGKPKQQTWTSSLHIVLLTWTTSLLIIILALQSLHATLSSHILLKVYEGSLHFANFLESMIPSIQYFCIKFWLSNLLHDSQHPYFCIKFRVNQLLFTSRDINQLKSLREYKNNCTLMRPPMVEWFWPLISISQIQLNNCPFIVLVVFSWQEEGMKDLCTSPSFLNDPWKDLHPGG